MPPLWPYLLLLVPAVSLARDDFRTRHVDIVWLIVLGVVAFVVGWMQQGLKMTMLHTAANAILILFFVGVMAGYQLLRHIPVKLFFKRCFGLGDIVMMLAVAPLFAPVAYVRFLLAGCLVALVWWSVKRSATIPLAGMLAVVLGGYVLYKAFGLWN